MECSEEAAASLWLQVFRKSSKVISSQSGRVSLQPPGRSSPPEIVRRKPRRGNWRRDYGRNCPASTKKRRAAATAGSRYASVFLVYLLVLCKLTVFKFPGTALILSGHVEPLPLAVRVQFGNFIPLRTILQYLAGDPTPGIALWNLAGNVVLFIPLGVLLPVVLPAFFRLRAVAAASFLLSLSIETFQLLTGAGQFAVDDLLLNVGGAVAGWWARRWLVILKPGTAYGG